MALSRKKKEEVLTQYQGWLDQSQAVFIVEYTGVTVKDLDNIRGKVRETGGEFHILKNTLARKAFEAREFEMPAGVFEKSTAVTFAFNDPASTAKALTDVMKTVSAIKIKGGLLEKEVLNATQVKALADLPPLPVARAQLLGVLQAPAGKLVRTLAEPARSLASVIRAYSENAPATA